MSSKFRFVETTEQPKHKINNLRRPITSVEITVLGDKGRSGIVWLFIPTTWIVKVIPIFFGIIK